MYNNNNNNNKKKKCLIIDMAVPSDRNTSTKVTKKLSKYKDLEIEINRMWGTATETLLAVIGALGLVKKGMDKYITKIPGRNDIQEIQKIVLLGSAHILRRVLSIQLQPLKGPQVHGLDLVPEADLKERYAVGELLADLAGCKASRVLLFVEQSYTGVLTKRLKGSLKHLNVVLLNGLSWVNTAQFWASLRPSHCLIDHLSKNAVMPHVGDGKSLLNVTLSGAPCNSTPPLSEAEMRKEYMGCQNLPTALWHQGRRTSHNSERN